MNLSDRTYIIILVVAILILIPVMYRNFQTPLGSLKPGDLPHFEMPTLDFNLESALSPERKGDKEWTSPDGKLKLAYPDNWMIMEQAFLDCGAITGSALGEEEVLLFVYHFKLAGQSFPYLIVSQIKTEKSLEQIMEEIKQNIESSGGEKEIIMLETKDETVDLEIIFRYQGYANFYNKGRIIFTEEKTYMIFFNASQQAWPQLKEEAENIFDSIELLQ